MRSIKDVRQLPLLARGGQAEIYAFTEGKVLRVPNRPQDFDRIRYEYRVYALLAETTAFVPTVYELLEIEAVPIIVMERLDGQSMMNQVKTRPWVARRKAVELARLHHNLLNVRGSTALNSTTMDARHCILSSQILADAAKEKVLSILDELPQGETLCHGDFHPGNIIHQDDRDYIIDWSGASVGDYHSDIAHTYFLLKVVPRVPGLHPVMHFAQKRIGRAIANTYLDTMQSERHIDYRLLSQWILVKAAERTYYGLPSEKGQLQRFVHACLASSISGDNEDLPYRLLQSQRMWPKTD